jgi:two-component system CheB/CheR fusion protein
VVRAAIEEAIQTKSLFELEHRVRRADGTLGWTLSRAVPILDRNGKITEWLGAAKDVTARRKAEAALRESEERFRAMADTAPVLIWETDASGAIFVNGHYLDFFGVDFDTIRGMGWAQFLHPDDAEGYVTVYREAYSQRQPYAFECRFRRADGQYRWLRNTGQPVGESRFVGCSLDVTDLQEAQFALRKSEERLKVLVAELQHRTRNLIGVVRAIADRTLAGASSLDEFRDCFRDRLAALARVNGLLSRLEEDDRISFDELLRTELAGHGIIDREGHGSQVVLAGPEGIPLRSSMVQTLALGLHELTTNAVKYGALSRPEGRLVVRWSLTDGGDGERRLRVEWRESGVPVSLPPDGQPLRQGYGRELIEQALPYQLSAETVYELTPEGVRCTITLPISTRHRELAHA